MNISRQVYLLTRQLPKEELFGLTSQMRRAAISIPSNIAEGHAKSTAHYKNHLVIAMGSVAELETQLLLTADLYGSTKDRVEALLQELGSVGRMMRSLIQKITP